VLVLSSDIYLFIVVYGIVATVERRLVLRLAVAIATQQVVLLVTVSFIHIVVAECAVYFDDCCVLHHTRIQMGQLSS